MTDLALNERYNYLVDDIRSIISQRIKNSKMEILTAKHEIGERLQQEFTDSNVKEYRPLIEKLSKDLKTSSSELYRCVEFYNKFPDFQKMLSSIKEGDNLNWNLIKTKYLPDLPSARIPFILNKVEMPDSWGILKWWMSRQDRNFILVIGDKKEEYRLVVKLEHAENITPFKMAAGEVRDHYVQSKGINKEKISVHEHHLINKRVKEALIRSSGDIEKAKKYVIRKEE